MKNINPVGRVINRKLPVSLGLMWSVDVETLDLDSYFELGPGLDYYDEINHQWVASVQRDFGTRSSSFVPKMEKAYGRTVVWGEKSSPFLIVPPPRDENPSVLPSNDVLPSVFPSNDVLPSVFPLKGARRSTGRYVSTTIFQQDLMGNEIHRFRNVREAALAIRGSETSIYRAVNKGIIFRGYRWKRE